MPCKRVEELEREAANLAVRHDGDVRYLRAQYDSIVEMKDRQVERAEAAEAEVERLRGALEELVTYQNGSPLPTYDEGWANAMRLARAALRGEGEK